MKMKIKQSVIIIAFSIILIIPIFSINKVSGKVSETEQRYLASFPELIDDNGKLIIHGFRSGFEDWLNDNIGFRDFFVKIHSTVSYKILQKSPSEKIEIGKDGWFYYTLNDNIKIADGTYPLTQDMLLNIKNSQEKIADYYNNLNIDYVLVLVPSKVSVYPENINSGNYEVGKTPIDILEEYLKNNSDVNVINLKDSLITAKDFEQVYFKTDTHWNEAGAYVGYQDVINKLAKFGYINTKPVAVKKNPSSHKGEFSAMMGDVNLLNEENTISTEIISPKAEVLDNTIMQQINASYAYKNKYIESKKVLMYGDSMFGHWNISNLFAENFSEFTFIWSYGMLKEASNMLKPDIVIYEITERFINNLEGFNADFVNNLYNPQAEIITHNTPVVINRDKKYDVNITVKNISEESWSEGKLVRLCIWQDGIDYGYRIQIPLGIEIMPGEEYTFTLSEFQAPESDSTYLEYQMVQEGRTYFGEKERVDVKVK
ncbi:hypothetical protein SDC9_41314 [bioreactor metagenome]|uniref:AlgX/AlgJ SGNH hydrolase-like domain-containing protein n=1 Tax=bioreactor metagenome TaxID=1076179 RepID=A0A644VUU3_9ZZZZ